jgi:hypothetical protein
MRVVVRAFASLFAVSWVVLPGFGAIDLAVTWSSDWPQVLEAGWGLFSTVIVGAAFVLVAARPRTSGPVALQLVVATVALAVSAVAADEGRLLWFAAALALETAIASALSRRLWRDGPDSGARIDLSRSLLVLASIGAVPWLAYAMDMWALNREGRVDADITIGIDHYSMQGALALSLVLLSFLAALRSGARPFTPVCTGVAACYLGLVSLAWQDAAGGFDRPWSAAAIAWGIALVLVPLLPPAFRRRTLLRYHAQNV